MLTINTKIDFFAQELLAQNGSYADSVKDEIYSYFFESIGDSTNVENFSFLNLFNSKVEITNKVNMMVSKIIMHEHHSGIEDLIEESCL